MKFKVKNLWDNLRHMSSDNMPQNALHDDIYLVEFPKSGITWLSFLLGNIELGLLGKQDVITAFNVHQYIPDMSSLMNIKIHRHFDRTFIKSHASNHREYHFSIYLIRNPVDVMVSFYNFNLDLGYTNSFSTFIRDEQMGINAWKNHVKGWLKGTTSFQRIHLLKYEDLLSQPITELSNIYTHLGLDIPDQILQRSVELSTLSKMKESEQFYAKHNPNYTMNFVGQQGKINKNNLCDHATLAYIKASASEIIDFYENNYTLKPHN